MHTGTKCENFRVGKGSVKVDLVCGDAKSTIEVDVVLSAIGVVANLEGVLAPALRPELDKNYLKVGDDYQTTIPGIYAAGDTRPPWLAHVATFEAVSAVNGMFGHGTPRRVRNFPGCTYCQLVHLVENMVVYIIQGHIVYIFRHKGLLNSPGFSLIARTHNDFLGSFPKRVRH